MSADDPRYVPVANTWPAVLPPITRAEAERAGRRLFRHFGGTALGSPAMNGPARFRRVRTCWISRAITRGHFRGWGRLAHDVSHDIFEARHPSFRPHDGGHATLEREIAEYIVAQGWLAGALKSAAPVKPSLDDKRAKRLAQTEAALERWERKRRRAENAIKKLKRRQRVLLRITRVQS